MIAAVRLPQLAATPEMRSRVLGVLYVLIAVVLWSTVPVGTKLLVHGQAGRAAQETGVFSVAFLSAARLWLAAAAFILLRLWHARRQRQPFQIPMLHHPWLYIAAGGIFINYILYGIGLRFTTAGATSIISQLHSIITVLLAALLLGERLTKRKVWGMAAAMAGVLFVIFQGDSLQELLSSTRLLGNVLQVLAALAWPLYAIGQTKMMLDRRTNDVLMPIFLLAGLLAALYLPFTGPAILSTPTAFHWLVLLFLGVGSTAMGYWLFALGLQRIETSEGTMFNVLIPPLALLLAHWLLHEPLRPSLLFGLAFVVFGLLLILWRRIETVPRAMVEHPASPRGIAARPPEGTSNFDTPRPSR